MDNDSPIIALAKLLDTPLKFVTYECIEYGSTIGNSAADR